MKSGELKKRKEARVKNEADLKQAIEAGLPSLIFSFFLLFLALFSLSDNKEAIEKFQRRVVHVGKQDNHDCKRLLRLLGVPIVEVCTIVALSMCLLIAFFLCLHCRTISQSLGEAEAQCAAMCRAGIVYATATEDMDALTFGSPVLVRHMTFSEARKMNILEFKLDAVLEELKLSKEQVGSIQLEPHDFSFSFCWVGVWMSSLLKFAFFVDVIIRRLSVGLVVRRRCLSFADMRILKRCSHALIRSRLASLSLLLFSLFAACCVCTLPIVFSWIGETPIMMESFSFCALKKVSRQRNSHVFHSLSLSDFCVILFLWSPFASGFNPDRVRKIEALFVSSLGESSLLGAHHVSFLCFRWKAH